MAPAKGTVYTIFPGEEFVSFLSRLQLEKIGSLLADPFPWLGKMPIPEPPSLRKILAYLGGTPGPFMM